MQQGGQLIESEHNVRTQLVLNTHRDLGGETVGSTINVAVEDHAVIVNDSARGLHHLTQEGLVRGVGIAGKLLREHLLEARAQAEAPGKPPESV